MLCWHVLCCVVLCCVVCSSVVVCGVAWPGVAYRRGVEACCAALWAAWRVASRRGLMRRVV